MNLFVCIKQVPATSEVKVDEATGVLLRGGTASKLNPYDLFALETALRLKQRFGGKVSVGTMGPLQAEAVIREAYLMGADEGYLFSDRRFGGADVLATSYTLSQAIRSIGDFDVVICGKQTTDGDTAQVGPAIAEHLGIAHAAWVCGIERDGEGLIVSQHFGDVIERCFMPFPCLITVEQDIFTPRLPSLKRLKETRERSVHVRDLSFFQDQDESHYGLCGSPTQVERIFTPDDTTSRELWEGQSLGRRLADRLIHDKIV